MVTLVVFIEYYIFVLHTFTDHILCILCIVIFLKLMREREREGHTYMLILVMGDGTRLPVAWKTGSGNK